MNKQLITSLLLLTVLTLSGCSDQLNLENAATPLAFGIDLDKNDKLQYFSTMPVYSRKKDRQSQQSSGTTNTLRQAKTRQDAFTAGNWQGRNLKVILIGKRLVQHEGWFEMLDVLFRDARNTVMDRVVIVDGKVSELFYLNNVEQPQMPILIRGMVDTKSKKSETYATTVQELHRQFYEKGVTPYMAEVKMTKKDIGLEGSALLNQKGKYVASLNAQETVLLSLLQKKAAPGVSLSYRIPSEPKTGPFATDIISFSASKIKTKIKTSYHNDRFQFDFRINMTITLFERLFTFDVSNEDNKLEQLIGKQMNAEIEKIIKKVQKHQIDPIGLGVHARAFEYEAYKKVEDRWGEAVQDAVINVKLELSIGSMGPVT
ncbi:Ger(x)C family spore germination protein [Paenibacillus sp. FJAT-27812]|uniref:Ger(x)C family spore germination protein n=1 Tax=Paenibacillus sp. FJAT-27812 TaxID=1684143 RepID=UPI0006A7C685|nr:Ger(x)C family spore germination protein [Paenibacillus sp. FJAT-27812]